MTDTNVTAHPEPMDLGRLEAFVQVARTGSISKAAESLFVTQPAVTARLQTLERDLGVPLLVRSRHGSRLTEAGRAFLPHAQHALSAVDRGREAVEDVRTGGAGQLQIGAAPAVSTYVLPAMLHRFRPSTPACVWWCAPATPRRSCRWCCARKSRSASCGRSPTRRSRHPPIRRRAGAGGPSRPSLRGRRPRPNGRAGRRAPDPVRPQQLLSRADQCHRAAGRHLAPRPAGSRQHRCRQTHGRAAPGGCPTAAHQCAGRDRDRAHWSR